MQLRLLLTATILIALGAIGVSHFIVRPHIASIVAARDGNLRQFQDEQRVHNNTKASLKDALAKLQETETNLLTTQGELLIANTKATEQKQLLARLESDLSKTRQDLAAAKADLAAWNALPIRVDQVKGVVAQVKKLTTENEVLQEELKILQAMIAKIPRDPDKDPVLPAGLKGKVLVVDPKYDFVVLDIGSTKGVEPRGVLLVARQSELVAKVRVASVQSERCIANVIPGWKLGEIKEGDLVLY